MLNDCTNLGLFSPEQPDKRPKRRKSLSRGVDHTGSRYGYFIVLGRHPERIGASRERVWRCQCTCGNVVLCHTTNLYRVKTPHCGCLRNYTDTAHANTKFHPEFSSWKWLHLRSKNNANRRNIPWNIELSDFVQIVNSPCYWCGIHAISRFNFCISPSGYTQRKHPTYAQVNGWIYHNGLDRIDSTGAYIVENVRPCCKYCNYARNEMTETEFLLWIKRIYTHSVSKQARTLPAQ